MLRIFQRVKVNTFCTVRQREIFKNPVKPLKRPQTDAFEDFSRFVAVKDSKDDKPQQATDDMLKKAFNQFRDRAIPMEELRTRLRTSSSQVNEFDFKWWVQASPLVEELPIVLKREFFEHNPKYVNNILVQSIIERTRKRWDRVICLELLKYHQQFIEQKDCRSQLFPSEEGFTNFISDLRTNCPFQFDELSVFYHCFHLNTSRLVSKPNLKFLVEAMGRIRWGKPEFNQEHLDYQGNHLADLLNMKFKQSLNENLQMFLADLFFGSPTYRESLLTLSLVFVMLGRLSQHSTDLSDLMEAFKRTAGQEKFTFYIEQHLPNVLRSYNQTLYHTFFTQALKQYKDRIEMNHKIEWVSTSPLDKYFLQGGQVYCNHSNVKASEPICYSINSEFDLNRPQTQSSRATEQSAPVMDLTEVQRSLQREYGVWEQRQKLQQSRRGSFTQAPKSAYSSNIGLGFMQYLKRAKEIDSTTTQVTQVQEEQKQESLFLMTKKKSEKAPVERKPEQQVFELIGEKDVVKSGITTQATTTTPSTPELIVDPELLEKATLEVGNLFVGPKSELLPRLQNYFINLDKSNNYQIYATQVLISMLREDKLGMQTLFKLFCEEPNVANVHNVDLAVSFETKECTVEKDYKKYLGAGTVFPYTIAAGVYDALLEVLSSNFSRRQLKKVMSHLCVYGREMRQSTLELLLNLMIQQKSPLCLLEVAHLLVKRRVVLTLPQVMQIVGTLEQFKSIDEECEPLIGQAFHAYGWEIHYHLVKAHMEGLIKAEQTTRHLHLYELLKDVAMGARTGTPKEAVSNFGVLYVSSLLQNNQTDAARRVLNNIRSLKSTPIPEFNGFWLHAHASDPDEAIKIFTDFVEKTPQLVDEKYLTKLCYVVQRNSQRLIEFFSNVVSEWVFSRRVRLTPEFIHDLSVTFMLTKEYTGFTTLIKIIFDEGLAVNATTKPVWVKIMKRCPDDAQKGQIKGGLEQIFGRTRKSQEQARPQTIVEVEEEVVSAGESQDMPFKEKGGRKDKKKLRFTKVFFTNSDENQQ